MRQSHPDKQKQGRAPHVSAPGCQQECENRLRCQVMQLQKELDQMPEGFSFFDDQLRLQLWTERFIDVLNSPIGKGTGAARFKDLISVVLAMYLDITQHKQCKSAQPPGKSTVQQILDGDPVPTFVLNAEHKVTHWNRACEAIIGMSARELVGTNLQWKAFYSEPRPVLADLVLSGVIEEMLSAHYQGGCRRSALIPGAYESEDFFPHMGEKGRWLHFTAAPIKDAAGNIAGAIETLQDITQQRESETRIHRLAHHDPLTSLPNRISLEITLAQALVNTRRCNSRIALMFLDLDNFKTINDSLCHAIGDQLLVNVARRLADTVQEHGMVARLGGDEFVIAIPVVAAAEAAIVADKILGRVAEPLLLQQREFHTTASIGITIFPDDGETVEAMMRNADTAMYHAKSLGRNNFQYFAAEMNLIVTERLEMDRKLRLALARKEFELHYQPQYEVSSRKVIGVEALLRWRHADDGLIAPGRFIPIAEETGLIIQIGEWVLREACRQLREWIDSGLAPLRVAVNMSARQLRQKSFPQTVAAVLAEFSLPPSLLELEITESAAMEHPEEAVKLLQALKDMGVALAIDDFGTGYSSLSYLKLLPIDRLKIDRSFVTDIDRDANDAAIARATIALAHSLGLQVIAEGVETAAQLALLGAEGCDEVQGYYLSRPLPTAEIRACLARLRW